MHKYLFHGKRESASIHRLIAAKRESHAFAVMGQHWSQKQPRLIGIHYKHAEALHAIRGTSHYIHYLWSHEELIELLKEHRDKIEKQERKRGERDAAS